MKPRNMAVLGRANYLSFKADCFNVIFVPYRGSNACILARNLSKEDALYVINHINGALEGVQFREEDYDGEEDQEETET